MDPFTSPEALLDRLDDVVVCHVGTTMTGTDPRAAFVERRLPGARYVSLDDDLAGSPGPVVGRHPLPEPDDFAAALGRLGIGPDDRVVAYDDRGGGFAARLVWMLRILGREASLLDGGSGAWPGPVESGEPGPVEPVEVATLEWPAGALADADDVAGHLAAGGVVVDSREAARFRGEVEPIDPVAGHVPGAVNLPFAEAAVDGRLRPADELAERFTAVAADDDPIVHCGSGVTACYNALAIEAAGLPRPRVYVGSWSGWISDPARPTA